MKLDKLPFNWFDIFVLVWLVMGIFRGRKRGMSEELLTLLQWIGIVLVSALLYKPLGDFLHSMMKASLSLLTTYIITYLLLAGVITGIFLLIQRGIGGKLIGSDIFGKSEYYLGMPAGMLRFALMLIFGLALLNARLYSREEILAYHKFQQENYGSDFFPGLQELQATVFEKSIVGPPIHKYLNILLIRATPPEGAGRFKQKEWNATP